MLKSILSVVFVFAFVGTLFGQQPDPEMILREVQRIGAKDLISNQSFFLTQKSHETAALTEAKKQLAASELAEKALQEQLNKTNKLLSDLGQLRAAADDTAKKIADDFVQQEIRNLIAAQAANPQVPTDIAKAETAVKAAQDASNAAFYNQKVAQDALNEATKRLQQELKLSSADPVEIIKVLAAIESEINQQLAKAQKQSVDADVAVSTSEATLAKTNSDLEKIPAQLAVLAQTSASLGAATAVKAPAVNASDAGLLIKMVELQTATNAKLDSLVAGQASGNHTLATVAQNTAATVASIQTTNSKLTAVIESNQDIALKIYSLQQTIVCLEKDKQERVNHLLGKLDSLFEEKGVNARTLEFANNILSRTEELVKKEAAKKIQGKRVIAPTANQAVYYRPTPPAPPAKAVQGECIPCKRMFPRW